MPWGWSALIGVVSAALTSAGIVPLVKGWFERNVTAATAADKLSDTALELLRQAKEDADEARREARDARMEANAARREAVEARIEAMNAAANMRRLVSAITNPYATLEELRKLVLGGEPT